MDESTIFSQGPGTTYVVASFTENPHLDFSIYGKGYYKAAKHLAKRLINKKTGYGDYDGYPIIFLFRHSIELYLKGCLIQIHTNASLGQDNYLLTMVNDSYKSHELLPLANMLKKALSVLFPTDKHLHRDFEKVVEVAREFDKIDKDSFAFRYPTDKKKNPSTDHHLNINIQTVYTKTKRAIDVLETLDFGLVDMEDDIQKDLGLLFEAYGSEGE